MARVFVNYLRQSARKLDILFMSQISLQNISTVLSSTTNSFRFPPVSAEFAVGEFVAIVGPSGVGKSTLLRLIAGLEHLTQGSILFDGEPVEHLPTQQRNVGMVFQNYALFPHLNVADNLGYALNVKKVKQSQVTHEVALVAKRLAISDLLGRYPKQLSGGQRQRVAIGRAMLSKPQLFLFDEPFSNLDPELRIEMRQQLKRLHLGLATTTLFVTHDQHEAMALAQRILLLSHNGVEQFDTPENIYRSPNNVYVARFFGEPKINLFDVKANNQGLQLTGKIEHRIFCDVPEVLYRQKLLMGIRPRAFRVSLLPIPQGIQMNVAKVEYLGDVQYLYLSPFINSSQVAESSPPVDSAPLMNNVENKANGDLDQGGHLVVVLSSEAVDVGQEIYLTFALADTLLFDENEKRISL